VVSFIVVIRPWRCWFQLRAGGVQGQKEADKRMFGGVKGADKGALH